MGPRRIREVLCASSARLAKGSRESSRLDTHTPLMPQRFSQLAEFGQLLRLGARIQNHIDLHDCLTPAVFLCADSEQLFGHQAQRIDGSARQQHRADLATRTGCFPDREALADARRRPDQRDGIDQPVRHRCCSLILAAGKIQVWICSASAS